MGRDAHARPPPTLEGHFRPTSSERGVWGCSGVPILDDGHHRLCAATARTSQEEGKSRMRPARHWAFREPTWATHTLPCPPGSWRTPGSGPDTREVSLASAQLARIWACPLAPSGRRLISNRASGPPTQPRAKAESQSHEAATLRVAQARPLREHDQDICHMRWCAFPSTGTQDPGHVLCAQPTLPCVSSLHVAQQCIHSRPF